MHDDFAIARTVSRKLRLVALRAGGFLTGFDGWRHISGVFDPAWLATLGLPINSERPSTQTIALIEGEQFERSSIGVEVAAAYSNRPRTQLYESVGARSGGWFGAVDALLIRLFGYEVTSDIYVSNAGDAIMGPHHDEWYGIIVQLDGAKEWTLWDDEGVSTTILLHAGEVLLVPRGVRHNVRTPDHSVHVVFAVMTDEPISELVAA